MGKKTKQFPDTNTESYCEESLDEVLSEKISTEYLKDTIECKLLGSEVKVMWWALTSSIWAMP